MAYNESLAWGELRTGKVGISGVGYVPTVPQQYEVEQVFAQIAQLPLCRNSLRWFSGSLKPFY